MGTLAGVDMPCTISVAGSGNFIGNGGSFTSSRNFNNGDTVQLRTNSLAYNTDLTGVASDTNGQVTREEDALGNTVDYNYGIHGQVTTVKDKNGNIVNDLNWLKHRYYLFETFCFPSILSQTNKNFKWLVFFDKDTPSEYVDINLKNHLLKNC